MFSQNLLSRADVSSCSPLRSFTKTCQPWRGVIWVPSLYHESDSLCCDRHCGAALTPLWPCGRKSVVSASGKIYSKAMCRLSLGRVNLKQRPFVLAGVYLLTFKASCPSSLTIASSWLFPETSKHCVIFLSYLSAERCVWVSVASLLCHHIALSRESPIR